MHPWGWGYYENTFRNYVLVYHLISPFLLYLQNYKEFEPEILDLQLEKYGLSFGIKKYTILLPVEPWGGDKNVIGIRSFNIVKRLLLSTWYIYTLAVWWTARYRNPLTVTWFHWAVNNATYFKLKIALVGGYRGMSGYWNEYGTYIHVLSSASKALQIQPFTRISLQMWNYDPSSQIFFPKGYPFHWPSTNAHPFHTPLAHTITETPIYITLFTIYLILWPYHSSPVMLLSGLALGAKDKGSFRSLKGINY